MNLILIAAQVLSLWQNPSEPDPRSLIERLGDDEPKIREEAQAKLKARRFWLEHYKMR
jgi:hypothetical protein